MKSQIFYKCLLTATLCLAVVLLNAQNKEFILVKGAKTSSELTTGETHRYSLNLDANQFVFANLFQRGIDLKITALDPDGKELGQFDSPNYRNGDEPVTLLTEKKGKYI